MTQEPHKNNSTLIGIAIIGVIGTVIGAIITVMGNYNVEKLRQETELTRIALASGQGTQPLETKNNLYDEFSNNELQSNWTWIREDKSHWSLTAIPGHLQILTQKGDVWETTNNLKNLLLQNAPQSDYTITTLLTIYPYIHAQQGGLYIYQDDKNYIRLSRGFMHSQNQIEFVLEQDDVTTIKYSPEASASVYLAITHKGNDYSGSYSIDGTTWIDLGEYTNISFLSPKTGLSAWNGDVDINEIPVIFDFFHITLNK